MNQQPKQDLYSIADYLKNELDSDSKHEYREGQMYAMAGASKNHQRITLNISSIFKTHLKNTPCDTFAFLLKLNTFGNYITMTKPG